MQTATYHVSSSRWPANVGLGWVTLTLALAVHVVDEAAHDFLTMYNANVRIIREHVPWLPVPIFSFRTWIAGLLLAIVLLLLLSPFAFRKEGAGARWIRPMAWFLAALMTLNGLNHIAASIYLGRLAPGVESSPVLLLASAYLVFCLCLSRTTVKPR